ncbi:ABC transporter substrate-binding protein [Paenibacillus sp. GCM10027626]|uniref:ABC transporter substrate-binding protein n=1 Tax=Paenibacillus sp. GCM10027626 TaxID=3273411 RepID=UPI0036367D9E
MKKANKSLGILIISAGLISSLAACGSNSTGSDGSSTGGNGNKKPVQQEEKGNTTTPDQQAKEEVYEENGLPKDQKVTLKLAFWENAGGREWIDKAKDSFTAKFPNVTFDVTYSPKIDTIIGTKIAANDDDDMFDIFSTNIGNNVNPLVDNNKIEVLDDLWDHKSYDESGKTLKELAQQGTYEVRPRIKGKMYALPISMSGTGLFFNKNLFEQKGWNQNPKTWTEFNQLVDAIKADGLIPITYPGQYINYLEYSLGFAKMFELAEANGNLETFTNSFRNHVLPEYTSPEWTEVYQRIYELGKKGTFPEGVAALTHTQSQMQMLQGQAAMVSTGVWVENEMKDSTPADFKWGYMVIPMTENPDATKYYQTSLSNGHYIWSGKPELNKKWAKEFLVWLWNLDVQQSVVESGSLPIRADYLTDPQRAAKLQDAPKALLEYLSNNKMMGENGVRNVTLSDPTVLQAKKVMDEATNNIVLGKQDPLPKLQEAEALLKKAIDAQAAQ